MLQGRQHTINTKHKNKNRGSLSAGVSGDSENGGSSGVQESQAQDHNHRQPTTRQRSNRRHSPQPAAGSRQPSISIHQLRHRRAAAAAAAVKTKEMFAKEEVYRILDADSDSDRQPSRRRRISSRTQATADHQPKACSTTPPASHVSAYAASGYMINLGKVVLWICF